MMVAVGVIAAVTPASAATSVLSDSQYLNLAHCAGLAKGQGQDSTGYEQRLDQEAGLRQSFILDQAQENQRDGMREAARTDAKAKAYVASQVSACKALAE
jgi:hypothetical protein